MLIINRLRSAAVVFTICLLLAQPSAAATLVVSPEGDDQAAGTADAPLQTISRAAELAKPGDTVLVKAGVYRERVAPRRGGEPSRPIVYRAAPGERVFIKGSEVWRPEWREHGDGVFSAVPDESLFNDRGPEYLDHHNPFKVELSSTPWQREGRREHERKLAGDDRIRETDPRIVYTCGQVFVGGQPYREVPLREELEPQTWFYEPQSEQIFVHFGALNPAEQLVELTTRRRLFAPRKRGLGHIVVEGFIFEHCGNQYPTNFWREDAWAQKGAVGAEAGHHWVIRRNVIRHAKTFAIDIGRVDRHSPRSASYDNVVEQNYLLDNGSAGILSNGSRNLVIRDNVVLRNNRLRFLGVKRWEQAGVKCHHFTNGLIENNYIADNYDTYGVWLDNQFADSRVSKNVIHNNGRAGVFLEMSDYDFDRVLIDHNVIFDNRENAVYIHDASGATFTHNLLANTVDTDRYGQAIYIRQVTTRTRSYHHSFFNNLLIGNARNVDVNYPAGRSGVKRFDCNVYGVAATGREFVVNDKSDKPTPWSSREFRELVLADLQESDLDLGASDNEPPIDDGSASMTLDQWRAFWRSHGMENDTRSQFGPGSSVRYDRETYELEVVLDIDPSSVGSVDRDAVQTDLLGDKLPAAGRAKPGPVQRIEQGPNRFRVWDGLPVLAEGELPPADWTR